MNAPAKTPPPNGRSRTGLILSLAFVVALLMGPGPGVLLVNRATTIFGLPAVYAWGLLWYVVEVVIVVWAYLAVWSKDKPGKGTQSPPPAE